MSSTAKPAVVVLLCLMALPLVNSAPQASMATEYIFDDPALERMKAQSNDSTTSNQLIVRISHDDMGPLTHNFTRVNELLMIETAITSLSLIHISEPTRPS